MRSEWTGRDCRAERARAGLTQAELAALLGVSPRRVASVEAQYRVTTEWEERIRAALHLPKEVTDA
jgi:transcriptional regulator with XRE-family HTH domain